MIQNELLHIANALNWISRTQLHLFECVRCQTFTTHFCLFVLDLNLLFPRYFFKTTSVIFWWICLWSFLNLTLVSLCCWNFGKFRIVDENSAKFRSFPNFVSLKTNRIQNSFSKYGFSSFIKNGFGRALAHLGPADLQDHLIPDDQLGHKVAL